MKSCQKCGKDSPDNAKFCRYCGNSLPQDENGDSSSTTDRVSEHDSKKETADPGRFYNDVKDTISGIIAAQPDAENDPVCPFCQAPDCQPMQKSTTEVNNKGYRWGSGCCGMFLFGPFGLLCGMCGMNSKVKVTNELWWTCVKCGKQHISLKDALAKWDATVGNLVMAGCASGIVLMIFRWLDIWLLSLGAWMTALIAPLVGMYQIHEELSEELGRPVIQYLTPQQKKDCLISIGISILLAAVIGIFGFSLLAYFLDA